MTQDFYTWEQREIKTRNDKIRHIEQEKGKKERIRDNPIYNFNFDEEKKFDNKNKTI